MRFVNGGVRCVFLEQGDPEKSHLTISTKYLKYILCICYDTENGLCCIIKRNANIKLLENRITTNREELMARACNVEIQAKEALDLA